MHFCRNAPYRSEVCVVSLDVRVDGARLVKLSPEVQENSSLHKDSDQILKRSYSEELRRDPVPEK